MKVYLSIPISGRDIEQVKKELLEVSKKIAAKGWEPVSPLDGVEDYSLPWEEYILQDLQVLRKCDMMCHIEPMLGSALSHGVMIEKHFCEGMGKPMFSYYMWLHQFSLLPKIKDTQRRVPEDAGCWNCAHFCENDEGEFCKRHDVFVCCSDGACKDWEGHED